MTTTVQTVQTVQMVQPMGVDAGRLPMRLVIINDYDVVVLGLSVMLGPFRDRVEVVDLAASEPSDEPADLALVDTFANERRAREIREQTRTDKLAIYAWDLSEAKVSAALEAGADGVLHKSLAGEALVTALEQICSGDVVVSPLGATGPGAPEQRWPGRQVGLSAREAEVVALVTRGLSNDEIAGLCFLTHNTVKSYIRNAYRKMGVSTRPQAIVWGVQHGFATT